VLVDGRREKASYRTEPGQVVTVEIPVVEKRPISGEDIPVSIVYEDGRPKALTTVLISSQHGPGIDIEALTCKLWTRCLRRSEQDRTKRSKLRQAQRHLPLQGLPPQ